MMNNNQKIKCQVASCMYQSSDYCTLNQIQISNSKHSNYATDQEETICQSFQCDEKNSAK